MVELAFHRANATIPPVYLDLSPEIRTRLIGHLRNRIRPLILAAYSKSSVNTDRAVEVMTSRLLSLQDTGALLPLVQALRIPSAQAVDVLASWIGISYFEYEYAGIQSQLREFSEWMNRGGLVREISSLTERDYLERLVQFVRKRLKEDWARVVETSSAYRDTYQALVDKGEIKGFTEFLLGCRRKYWMMGDTLGRFEQTANVWTAHKRQLLSQTMTARAMIAFFSILRNLYGAPPQASRTKLVAAAPGRLLLAQRRSVLTLAGRQTPRRNEQADGHHRQVGHHVVDAEEGAHRPQHLRGVGIAAAHHLVERPLGGLVPVPGVLERLDLRLGALAARRLEQHVVGGLTVERRVEIDQIDARIGDVIAQDVEIVAVEQVVVHARSAPFSRTSNSRNSNRYRSLPGGSARARRISGTGGSAGRGRGRPPAAPPRHRPAGSAFPWRR